MNSNYLLDPPIGVVLEECNCPLGCSKDDGVILRGFDRINNIPGQFTLVRCNHCELMRTNPRPTPETISAYYPSSYGPYLGTIARKPSLTRFLLSSLVKKFIDFRVEAIPDIKRGYALEFGCASGSYLCKLAIEGWIPVGIEFSRDAADRARDLGFEVYVGAIENISLPESKFDLVVGWMVLEHLHQPVEVLKSMHIATNKGAWMAISVPNCADLSFVKFCGDWFPLQLPTHLFHFTPSSLRKVLDAGGWEIKRCMHQRIIVDWLLSIALARLALRPQCHWAQLVLRLPEGRTGLLLNLLLYPFALITSSLGVGTRMTVWAQRKD
jgi:SAM-dependent methyltransferase